MKNVLASLVSLSFLALASCASAPDEEADGTTSSLSFSTFDPDAVLSDAEMLDTTALSAARVDAFLARPYPQIDAQASCLAGRTFSGKSVGILITAQARASGVNPLFLLAHLQKESSLVGATGTCEQADLDAAFGCGCPDGGSCDPAHKGFEKQLACAGTLTRSYLDALAGGGATVSGWKVGRAKTTLDGRTITPSTRAAAVLYTYTPWVGDKTSGGNAAPFGNYLFWKTYAQFARTVGYKGASATPSSPPAGATSCSSDAQCNGGQSGTGKVCSTSSRTCIAACHGDSDCPSGNSCDTSKATWSCVAAASSPSGGGSGTIANVPYECQNDNGTGLGSSTCQITSAGMVLRYWGAKGKGSGASAYALNILNTYGDYNFAKSPSGVAQIFRDYGLYAKSTTTGTIAEMKTHLAAGRPLVVNGFFTRGHVVVFTGYDASGFFVNDPNGDWNGTPYVSGSQSYPGTSCPGTSGKAVHISYALLASSDVICSEPGACYEGSSGIWYAVASGAPF